MIPALGHLDLADVVQALPRPADRAAVRSACRAGRQLANEAVTELKVRSRPRARSFPCRDTCQGNAGNVVTLLPEAAVIRVR